MKRKSPNPIQLPIVGWVVVAMVGVSHHAVAQDAAIDPQLFTRVGTIETDKISESSGVAASGYRQDCFWTSNDSGQPAELYCLKYTGQLICEVKFRNGKNEDWEAMSSFRFNDVPQILVADVGDNLVNRANYQIYFFPEPEFKPKKKIAVKFELTPQRLDFTYEDGSKNCEAVAVDPLTLDLWLIEKIYLDSGKKQSPGIYVLPLKDSLNAATTVPNTAAETEAEHPRPLVATRIADFPIRNVTGMDFSLDGKRLIIRNYFNAHLYQRTGETNWIETVKNSTPIPVPLPIQTQGEAIGFSADSNSLFVTSEMTNQPVWSIDLEAYLKRREESQSK